MNPIHGVLVDIEAGVAVSNIYRRIGGVPSRHRFVQGLVKFVDGFINSPRRGYWNYFAQ